MICKLMCATFTKCVGHVYLMNIVPHSLQRYVEEMDLIPCVCVCDIKGMCFENDDVGTISLDSYVVHESLWQLVQAYCKVESLQNSVMQVRKFFYEKTHITCNSFFCSQLPCTVSSEMELHHELMRHQYKKLQKESIFYREIET